MKSDHTANGSLQHSDDASHTVKAALEYPVVKDTFKLVKGYRLGGYAATTVSALASYATPVTDRFHDRFDAADRYFAQKVGSAGAYLPLLHKPTDEIVDGAKTYATSAAAMVERNVGEPVRRTATSALERVEPYARAADARLLPVRLGFAHTINTLIPSNTCDESESDSDDLDSTTQTFRIYMLSLKAQRRLSRRVKAQISSTAHYTEKQIKQLQESTALLQKTTETVNQLNARLLELVIYAKETGINLKGKVQNSEDLRAAVTERFQSVIAQTEVIGKFVRENAGQFPEYLQERLMPMSDFLGSTCSNIMSEIQKSDADVYQKAFNIYKITEQQTIPVLNAAKAEMSKTLQYVSKSVNHTAENAKALVASNPVARTLGVTN